jgi:uncharacterized protein YcbX
MSHVARNATDGNIEVHLKTGRVATGALSVDRQQMLSDLRGHRIAARSNRRRMQ